MSDQPDTDPLLTPYEVASLFQVEPKTVAAWAKAGKFPPGTVVRTAGGHRRYRRSGVVALFDADPDDLADIEALIADLTDGDPS